MHWNEYSFPIMSQTSPVEKFIVSNYFLEGSKYSVNSFNKKVYGIYQGSIQMFLIYNVACALNKPLHNTGTMVIPINVLYSIQNVVVVNQPSAPQTVVTHQVIPRANDHMVFTIVMLVICCIHGNWLALICLIPALIFSLSVSQV